MESNILGKVFTFMLDRNGEMHSPHTILRRERRSVVHHALDKVQSRYAVGDLVNRASASRGVPRCMLIRLLFAARLLVCMSASRRGT